MKIKRSMELRAEELTDFFSIYNAVQGEDSDVLNLARRLARFFEELPAFAPIPEQPVIRSPQATDLAAFFSAVKSPLESEKERGGLLNFWRITGLKYNEVRTAGALAGLWQHDFGGRVSLAFIECYLAKVVPNLNWQEELREGYSVFTEINPLGDMADRVDLVIETRRYLIGIEIKIRAGLGLRVRTRSCFIART